MRKQPAIPFVKSFSTPSDFSAASELAFALTHADAGVQWPMTSRNEKAFHSSAGIFKL